MIRRWETASRYYIARLEKDLLGDLVLIEINGGKFNRLGHQETRLVADWSEGIAEVTKIELRRKKHHYVEVSRDTNNSKTADPSQATLQHDSSDALRLSGR